MILNHAILRQEQFRNGDRKYKGKNVLFSYMIINLGWLSSDIMFSLTRYLGWNF